MARYRKIDVRISLDPKVRRLSPIPPCGEGLWHKLLACPYSNLIPGLFRLGRAAMAEWLGWPLEAFDKAFEEVFREGLAEADWDGPVVWIPNAIKYDPPSNPNVVTGWELHWDEIPESPLKVKAWDRFYNVFREKDLGRENEGKKEVKQSFLDAFRKACPKPSGNGFGNPSRNQEQEQEQEQKQEQAPILLFALPAAVEPPAQPPPPEVFIWIPIIGKIPKVPRRGPVRYVEGKPEYGVTREHVETWRETYPGVNVEAELRKIRNWNVNNPGSRKTYPGQSGGVLDHIEKWLSREQNKGRGERPQQEPRRLPVGATPRQIAQAAEIPDLDFGEGD